MEFDNIKTNLEKKGYRVSCFRTAEEAADYLVGEIRNTTVSIGGSVTVQTMGLCERLREKNRVIWHWSKEDGVSNKETLRQAMCTDVYLSSVNALAETGEIVNIDGTGNRVASTLYGHDKVYFIVGRNKIAPDYDAALNRARNVASPLNAKRLQKNTPCAAKGEQCYNCQSPERICRALTVLWGAPFGAEYEIVLIDEDLGY